MLACRGIVLAIDKDAVARLGSRAAVDMVNAAGKILEADVKLMVSVPGTAGPRTGRTYDRGKKQHTASAPGEPPAVDTGRLRNSIVTQAYDGGKVARIGPSATVNYAAELEDGIPGEMAPRPYLRPVIDRYAGTDELSRRAAKHAAKLGRV